MSGEIGLIAALKKEKKIASIKISIPLAVAFKGLFDAALITEGLCESESDGAENITLEEAEARLKEAPYVGRYKRKNIGVTFIGKTLYLKGYDNANGLNKGAKAITKLEEDQWEEL